MECGDSSTPTTYDRAASQAHFVALARDRVPIAGPSLAGRALRLHAVARHGAPAAPPAAVPQFELQGTAARRPRGGAGTVCSRRGTNTEIARVELARTLLWLSAPQRKYASRRLWGRTWEGKGEGERGGEELLEGTGWGTYDARAGRPRGWPTVRRAGAEDEDGG